MSGESETRELLDLPIPVRQSKRKSPSTLNSKVFNWLMSPCIFIDEQDKVKTMSSQACGMISDILQPHSCRVLQHSIINFRGLGQGEAQG